MHPKPTMTGKGKPYATIPPLLGLNQSSTTKGKRHVLFRNSGRRHSKRSKIKMPWTPPQDRSECVPLIPGGPFWKRTGPNSWQLENASAARNKDTWAKIVWTNQLRPEVPQMIAPRMKPYKQWLLNQLTPSLPHPRKKQLPKTSFI